MATVKLELKRIPKKDRTYQICLLIRHKGKATEISLKKSIDINYWDNGRVKRNCPQYPNTREINSKLSVKLNEAWECIDELTEKHRIDAMNASQIANYIKNGGRDKTNTVDFLEYLKKYLPKIENASTREKYSNTLSILDKYTSSNLFFDDITKPWLNRFKEWRNENASVATTAIDLRNIKAVFNRAIDVDEIIGVEIYPFRAFDIPKSSPRNLRLPVSTIKSIRDFEARTEREEMARDFFMLSFYLIGMNNSDIYDITEIVDGRIEYERNKTDKPYSIKVEPEAMALIEKWKGTTKFLKYQERYSNPKNLTKNMNKAFGDPEKDDKCLRAVVGVHDLVMYHARHSWAGFAAKKPIGAGEPLIKQSLGHGRKSTTTGYFDFDNGLVDDLNRKVIDLLK